MAGETIIGASTAADVQAYAQARRLPGAAAPIAFDFGSISVEALLEGFQGDLSDLATLVVGDMSGQGHADSVVPLGDQGNSARSLSLNISAAQTSAVLLSAGFVWWSLRVAGLLASMLASTPVWRHLDPIPVLGATKDDDDDDEVGPVTADQDEQARDEAASRELLDEARRGRVGEAV